MNRKLVLLAIASTLGLGIAVSYADEAGHQPASGQLMVAGADFTKNNPANGADVTKSGSDMTIDTHGADVSRTGSDVDVTTPSNAKPDVDDERPEVENAETDKPDIDRPEVERPEVEMPDVNRPEIDR